MKQKYLNLAFFFYLLLSVSAMSCSKDDSESDSKESSQLVGSKWTSTYEDFGFGDDDYWTQKEIFQFFFYSQEEGTFYYRGRDEYSDTGISRESVVCHFKYVVDGNDVLLEYITDDFLGTTRLKLNGNTLLADDLEFTRENISYSDHEWLNTFHGTTGSCSWYSDDNANLWIIGDGPMDDYTSYSDTPWGKSEGAVYNVVVEEGVTTIGSYAFATYVTEVELPDKSLKQIGDAAFYGSLIKTISLCPNITVIGRDAFADCRYLKNIDIPESIVTIGESAFSGTALNQSELKFGSNLRTIGREAFFGCEASDLIFAEGVQSISHLAFLGDFCGDSQELILPNSLTSIGEGVFRGPYKKIVIGSGITEIGGNAFMSGATSGKMYINRSTPPSTGDNIIVDEDECESRWTLYVPKGCKSTYSKKAPWNKFKSIIEDGSLDGTGESGEPDGPGEPGGPDEPDGPGEPGGPDEPDGPGEPGGPDEPDDDTVHFPDANFKAYMVANFDKNNDGKISKDEASLITKIDCSDKNIQSLEGIQYCTALKMLSCGGNQLTALDLSKNTALTNLSCGVNQLTALDVSKNTALTHLSCSENQLTTLDVSNNTALTSLYCFKNQLTTLNVSNNTALTNLSCGGNQLTTLNVSKNTTLIRLECKTNKLTILDVSKNTALTYLRCSYNQLTTLDVNKTNLGNSTEHSPLFCDNMPTLQTLYLKKGWKIHGINVNRSTSCIPSQTEILYKD